MFSQVSFELPQCAGVFANIQQHTDVHGEVVANLILIVWQPTLDFIVSQNFFDSMNFDSTSLRCLQNKRPQS